MIFLFNGPVVLYYQFFHIFFIVLQAITHTKNITLIHIEQITFVFHAKGVEMCFIRIFCSITFSYRVSC